MAISKFVKETTMSIEVQKGLDKDGDPIFGKKSFSNIRENAEDQNIYDVGNAIKGIIKGDTGNVFVTVLSKLDNAE